MTSIIKTSELPLTALEDMSRKTLEALSLRTYPSLSSSIAAQLGIQLGIQEKLGLVQSRVTEMGKIQG